jgi:hypothetical protein
VVRSHRRDIDVLREAAAVLPSEFSAPLLNLKVTQRSRVIVGDKRIAPYLDEVVKDDYGGAIPGGMLRQMLDMVGTESAERILRAGGFGAIDSGRDVRMLVKHGRPGSGRGVRPEETLQPQHPRWGRRR